MSLSSNVPPIVSITSLHLTLHQRRMISDLSFTMAPGDCVALVGPNGAGKTSLLRVLCGLYREYEGSVKVFGREVASEPVESLSRLVSLVPQRMEFLPGFTVSEYLELSRAEAGPSVDTLLEGLHRRLLPELSGGELQRVIIAGAVAQGAKLLLLDEPSSHLDPSGRAEVEKVLKTCRDTMGISYLLVTHDISLAMRCCTRMLVMVNGEREWSGSTAEDAVVSHLEKAYGCGFVRVNHESSAQPMVLPT